MTTHKTGTRAEWLAARLELLAAEAAVLPPARCAERRAAHAPVTPGVRLLRCADRSNRCCGVTNA